MNEVLAPPGRTRRLPLPHPWLSIRRRRDVRRARRTADRELLQLLYVPPRLAWRADELTRASRRLALARSVRRLVASADPRYVPGASIVNRVAVRDQRDLLLCIGRRLSAVERPVAVRGVLLVELLLGDADGPLYVRDDRHLLAPALDAALAALEAV